MPTFYSNCATLSPNSGCVMYFDANLTIRVGLIYMYDGVKCYELDLNSQIIDISEWNTASGPPEVPELNFFQVYLNNTGFCIGTILTVFTSSNATSLATANLGDTIYKYPQGNAVTGYRYITEVIGSDIYNMSNTSAQLGASTGISC